MAAIKSIALGNRFGESTQRRFVQHTRRSRCRHFRTSAGAKNKSALSPTADTCSRPSAASALCHFRTHAPQKKDLLNQLALVTIKRSQSAIAAIVIKRFKASGKLLSTLSSPAILFAEHAAPCRKPLGRMLLHPLGELRRTHQAGLHRDVSEVRGGDGLLVAICR